MGITLWQSMADRTRRMADSAFDDVKSAEDWERIRPQRYKEFMRCMGLAPMPERCDPKVTNYGTFKGEGFRARRIGFQMLPDCWSSACVYYPDPAPETSAPAVLYVCGHAEIGTYHYQYHPIMWARRGYVCLVLDTLEQNDNPGEHDGFLARMGEKWLSMGYTPAGGEAWNSIRALDLLAADPLVDAQRVGVTGVSGGGAVSFYVAAIDERIKAVSTLCGVCSPVDAVENQHVMGHCDCMFPHNVYGRDISEYAALIAPRAVQWCYAEHDTLFHIEETRALAERAKGFYRTIGMEDRCALVTCPGKHGDHPEFDEATCRWFDRHVAGEERPSVARGDRDMDETVTTVFNGQPPSPNRLRLVPEIISRSGSLPLPKSAEEWPGIRDEAIRRFREDVLAPIERHETGGALEPAGEWDVGTEIPSRVYRGEVGGVGIRLIVSTPKQSRPAIVLGVGAEEMMDRHALTYVNLSVEGHTVASAGLQPRIGAGHLPCPVGETIPHSTQPLGLRGYYLRAMALGGVTPVMTMIRDIGLAVECLMQQEDVKDRKLYLCGRGESGVAALYYALLDERVAGVAAEYCPGTHLDGAPILGVLRHFDMPQAAGLMAPRKVSLASPSYINWSWTGRVFARVGCQDNFSIAADMRDALKRIVD